MKCPFSVDVKEVTQITFEYDDEGRQTFQQTKVIQQNTFIECTGEECGMWQDGQCRRSKE